MVLDKAPGDLSFYLGEIKLINEAKVPGTDICFDAKTMMDTSMRGALNSHVYTEGERSRGGNHWSHPVCLTVSQDNTTTKANYQFKQLSYKIDWQELRKARRQPLQSL